VANLKYLTTKQALADIITFQQYIKTQFNLTSKNKWVSFGGSYSGALSAWLRDKYPNNFHAAYASSAPIQATVNFYQYMEIVAAALRNVSTACLQNVNVAVSQMKKMATSNAGLKNLSQIF
jgi:enterochelin esterase-like enzyme